MLFEITLRCSVEQSIKVMVEVSPNPDEDMEHIVEEIAMEALDEPNGNRPGEVSVGQPFDITYGDIAVTDTKLLHL